MMQDQAERAKALDPAQSFIVQAPAGSGKTELLTQRYLRLLARVPQPEQVLAITFTRKAAAEMRQRVLTALAQDPTNPPATPHQQTTWKLAQAVRAQDMAQGWQLTRNPNQLRIQTFDSLAAELTQQLPVLSELGAQPQVTEQPLPLYQQAAQATLTALTDPAIAPHLTPVLRHLDNRLGQVESLLCTMLSRREQWLPALLQMPDITQLETALQAAIEHYLQPLAALFPETLWSQITQLARFAARHVPPDHPIYVWDDHLDPPTSGWHDLTLWQGLATLLLTDKGTVRKTVDKRLGFPAANASHLTSAEKQTRKAAKAEMKQVLAALATEPSLIASLAFTRHLPSHGYQPEQIALLEHLQQVLLYAAAQLQIVFQATGQVDFTEIQQRAIQALGNPHAPTDLALALDYRLQHILVDEFQDTSSSQYRLLRQLTAGWQPHDGRSLFLVGDPMQSIYRFRAAEVGLYLQTRADGLGDIRLTPLTLQMNFRSQAHIVEWVNTSFAALFPTQADASLGAVCYATSQAALSTTMQPAVHWHPFAARDDQAEAQQIVHIIHQTQQQEPMVSIALLARSRTHLATIASALDTAQIRYQAVDINPLGQRPVVQDLQSLTLAILRPADHLSWLAILRAPWLGLSLADLACIAEGNTTLIYARLQTPAVQQALSTDGQIRVQRLLKLLQPLLPLRGRLALRSMIEGLWLTLGGLALAGAAGQADAQAYFALLDQLEEPTGRLDCDQLNTQLQRLYAAPNPQANDRLQLLTMHAAKGLEFDVVILPGLGRQPRRNQRELLYWQERPHTDGTNTLLMAPIQATYTTQEPLADFMCHIQQQKDHLETTRLFYVAATRARQQLHLFGHCTTNAQGQPKPAANSLLHQLWPIAAPHFVDLAVTESSSLPIRTVPPEQRLAADWQLSYAAKDPTPAKITKATSTITPDWPDETARHVGTLVHRYLERIAQQGLSEWPTERLNTLRAAFAIALTHLGVPPSAIPTAVENVHRALTNTLNDAQGRWILQPHTAAASEWALTCQQEQIQHYVLDRTFIDEHGIRWIIDYKTAEPADQALADFLDQQQARYQDQLQGYAQLLRQQEKHSIRLALYFPLCPGWRAWDYLA